MRHPGGVPAVSLTKEFGPIAWHSTARARHRRVDGSSHRGYFLVDEHSRFRHGCRPEPSDFPPRNVVAVTQTEISVTERH
jgi:hypothetical protein